jgi:hypothetical protein
MIIFHTVEQGTEAWHKLRKGLWTGSIAVRLLQVTQITEKITNGTPISRK